MKTLNTYINERLVLSKTKRYTSFPKTKEELYDIVESEIKKNGNECSLNHIDVSKITDLSTLFCDSKFDGDISDWNVSNATSMRAMFAYSEFSSKNSDISKWDVSNVTTMKYMFSGSKFNGDISNWDVSNVTNMHEMFVKSKFDGDISNWDVSSVTDMVNMFDRCPLQINPPKWYNN